MIAINRKIQSAAGAGLVMMFLVTGIHPVAANPKDQPVPFVDTPLHDLEADTRLPVRPVLPNDIPAPRPLDPTSARQPQPATPQESPQPFGTHPEKVPNQLIVKFKDRTAFHNDLGHRTIGTVVDESPDLNGRLLKVPDVAAAINALRRNPNVEFVEENLAARPQWIPNDPSYAQQWHLKPWTTQRGSNLQTAWNVSGGSPHNRIVIVDTGVNFNHRDLKGKNPLGHNFVTGGSDWGDCHGHGTQVAGIAAAVTGNGVGVAGADIYGNIYVAKISTGCTMNSNIYYLGKAIGESSGWAGTKVINVSFGGYGTNDWINWGVQTARSRNVVVVAAAGNDNTNAAFYPAATMGVLGVGATDPQGARVTPPRWTWGSNWGAPNVDVAAPGEVIYTTNALGGYSTFNGTSAASPLVAGIAMLVRARYPQASEGTIRFMIQRGSYNPERNCWNCYSNNYGYGVVDAYQAVR